MTRSSRIDTSADQPLESQACQTRSAADFSDLVDELMERIAEGELMDLDAFCRQHPECEKQLRQVFPVIQAVASLRQSELPAQAKDSLSESAPQPPTAIDSCLGDFRIIREIGRGGMGIVYEAEQISLQRRVALKVLPFAALLDSKQLQRFQNEARAAAMLRHPGIVNVFHVGCERSVHYYAMDLIDGQSLADVIAALRQPPQSGGSPGPSQHSSTASTGAVPQETVTMAQLTTQGNSNPKQFFRSVARLGIKAAVALHAAHEQGVIHRDIKPSNLLLDSEGELFLTDFGLARIASDDLTITGDLIGTLRYMSPEQLAGRRPLDHRTDIFSLGLTLYELATGQAAFPATTRPELAKELSECQPAAPSRICPGIPRDLETIILKAIAREPSARYATAAEMADDLQRFLDQRTITARRTSQLEKIRRWVMANQLIAGLLAAVILLLSGLAVGSARIAVQQSRELNRRELREYATSIRLAQKDLDEGRKLEAEQRLLACVPDDSATDHRGVEWSFLWRSIHDPALEHTISHTLPVYAVDIHDNQLAIGAWSRHLRVWDTRNALSPQVNRQLELEETPVRMVRFLNNSQQLLTADASGMVAEWDLTRRQRQWEFDLDLRLHENHRFCIDYSADERYLVVGAGNDTYGKLLVLEWPSRQAVLELDDLPGQALAVSVAADTLLVANRCERRISFRRLSDGGIEAEREVDGDHVRAIAVTPDRTKVALAVDQWQGARRVSHVEIWDTLERSEVCRIPTQDCVIRCLRFSPDGDLLAVGSESDDRLMLFDETGDAMATWRAHGNIVSDIAFSTDGDHVISAGLDGQVHFWSLSALRGRRTPIVRLNHPLEFTLNADFVDSDTACSPSGRGELVLWNVYTGEAEKLIPLDIGDMNSVNVALSDDRRLAAAVMGSWPIRPGKPGRVQVIDLVTFDTIATYELPRGEASGENSEFCHDGRYLVTLHQNVASVFDLAAPSATQRPREVHFPCEVKGVRFAPDNQSAIVLGTDGLIYELSVPDFQRRRTVRGDQRLAIRADYSPDGTRLAVVGFDRRVNLFDSVTLQPLDIEFSAVDTYLVDVRFSPDGSRLLTASPDGRVQLWHAESGEQLLSFPVRKAWYPRVAFAPDGGALVFGSGPEAQSVLVGDTRELHRLTVQQLTDIACEHITRHE